MRITSFLSAAVAAAAPAMAAPRVELSTGLEYQEGDYGTGQDIESWSVPTSLRVEAGQVLFRATRPDLIGAEVEQAYPHGNALLKPGVVQLRTDDIAGRHRTVGLNDQLQQHFPGQCGVLAQFAPVQ